MQCTIHSVYLEQQNNMQTTIFLGRSYFQFDIVQLTCKAVHFYFRNCDKLYTANFGQLDDLAKQLSITRL